MVVRDWLAAMLNDLTNCVKAGKKETTCVYVSNLMLNVLEIMKKHGYVKDYKVEENKFRKVKIEIGNLIKSQAIKPRFFVNKKNMQKYIKRYLPARDVGILIVSTNKGLLTHHEALQKNVGGCLIAYCY